jgi:hypothetical protein
MIPLFFFAASLLAAVSRFGVPGVAEMAEALVLAATRGTRTRLCPL